MFVLWCVFMWSVKKTGHWNPEQYTLSTLMGIAWSEMIYIYLFLCNSHVPRDYWVYITNKWFSLFVPYAFSIISLVHIALPALSQCHLHFPRIHYQAVAICIAFIPQVAPHMEITHYIPSENIAVEFCSTNHRLHCYLVITSLFYVWNHSTTGLQIEKANYLTNVHLLSWGGHDFFFFLLYFSPACALPLSSTAGRQKEVRATEVLFWLFIHGFSI